MTNKLYITFFAVILLIGVYNISFAAGPPPGNDAICSATTLPVNGVCVTGQTNVDATPDIYGGCVQSNYPSVWYTFTITGSNTAVDVTLQNATIGGGGDVATFLLSGTCGSPSGISTVCDDNAATFTFNGLSTGVTYFLLVSTQPGGNQGAFDICATQYINVGSMTGPEQDCAGAIPVCSSTITLNGSYTGFLNQEVSTSTCLAAGENNSVWYIFTAQANGALDFLITTTKDYDFALYDITTIGCAGIPSAIPERCNWSGTLGNTGLVTPNATKIPKLNEGAMGTPTMAGISNMLAGETYVLVIDNWTGDNTGFTIDFGTSPMVDVTAPTIVSAVASCTDNTILITMSEDIKCLSIIPTAFTLFNNTTATSYTSAITEVIGYNCPITDDALTKQIRITHNGTLTSGNYTITFLPPTPEDKCGNPVVANSTVSFNYLGTVTLSGGTGICTSSPVSLDANGVDGSPALATYTLNPGGLTNTTNGIFSVTPTSTTTYTVSVTYGGCTKTASQTITIEGSVVVSITPIDPQVCPAGTVTLTASTTINGTPCVGCTYLWSSLETTASVIKGAGTYTVQATTSAGCLSNIASSTVSEASGAPGTCNVYYVTPAGSGSGLTKTDPASLTSALASAACSNSIIKMSTGIYSLTNRVMVTSYLTLEGGYDPTFTTKSSNMTGGASSTTVQRSNAADSDDANGCTAFKINNSSTAFRFQDLRIEMPGSPTVAAHAASSNKTNYGIRMGTGCTSYNIVRCYIDAGVGSNQ